MYTLDSVSGEVCASPTVNQNAISLLRSTLYPEAVWREASGGLHRPPRPPQSRKQAKAEVRVRGPELLSPLRGQTLPLQWLEGHLKSCPSWHWV